MDQKTFIKTMRSWQNGSITRRDFLGRTGLGLAAAVVATNMPGLLAGSSSASALGAIVSVWRPGPITTARKTSITSPRPRARGSR
jgi:acyl-CoA reductase-like NAD-dependent aldehyde dehydrogenase